MQSGFAVLEQCNRDSRCAPPQPSALGGAHRSVKHDAHLVQLDGLPRARRSVLRDGSSNVIEQFPATLGLEKEALMQELGASREALQRELG